MVRDKRYDYGKADADGRFNWDGTSVCDCGIGSPNLLYLWFLSTLSFIIIILTNNRSPFILLVRTPTPSQILSPGSLINTEWGGIHDVPKTQN